MYITFTHYFPYTLQRNCEGQTPWYPRKFSSSQIQESRCDWIYWHIQQLLNSHKTKFRILWTGNCVSFLDAEVVTSSFSNTYGILFLWNLNVTDNPIGIEYVFCWSKFLLLVLRILPKWCLLSIHLTLVSNHFLITTGSSIQRFLWPSASQDILCHKDYVQSTRRKRLP